MNILRNDIKNYFKLMAFRASLIDPFSFKNLDFRIICILLIQDLPIMSSMLIWLKLDRYFLHTPVVVKF